MRVERDAAPARSGPPDGGRPALADVALSPRSLDAFGEVLAPADVERLRRATGEAARLFSGRSVFNVNSTAVGGGVAELLTSLLPFARGAGVDAQWLVIGGDPMFFRLTKRLHHRLHGAAGDGGPLGALEREHYEAVLRPAAQALLQRVRPGDVVLLHDPQTVGLATALRGAGVSVVWRLHIGVDHPGELARSAWAFLAPYVKAADVCVFSRPAYAWDIVPPDRRAFIAPSIDPFSTKNRTLAPDEPTTILQAAGILAGTATHPGITRRAEVEQDVPLEPIDRFVAQVSRWDVLKDPEGVIDGFARYVAPFTDVHLVLAGPDHGSVADDPEAAAVFDRLLGVRADLEGKVRRRVHLVRVPLDDPVANDLIVNALQRSAAVVVQKSLAEGFGLTVTEAMWKSRPVVASALGGIQDQIDDGVSGRLLEDPRNGAAFGQAVRALVADPARAAAMGSAARERVRERYLSNRSLIDYLRLLAPLVQRTPA